ncbi:MAG: hypothetical protein NC118_15660, partial [Eubacterium sp.]|nr:hypothetical protein [Eubacterium sp.]
LSHIELATDDDKEHHIDCWAKLFKATTWEEIKMLAAKDQYINEASKAIFQLSAEEQILKRCRDREEYYLDLRAYEREVDENKKTIAEKEKIIAKNENIISEKDIIIAEDKKIITEKEKIIAKDKKTIKELLDKIEMLKSNTGK